MKTSGVAGILMVIVVALISSCDRHPTLEDGAGGRRPEAPPAMPMLCHPSQPGAPGCQCQGQEWFPTCDSDLPASPDSSFTIKCAPSSPARGDTVACSISLMPFHLPDDTTDFVVSVRLTDSLGNVGSDSTYLIMFDYGDGVVTTTANVWKWELKGPAVTASRFGVYFAAKDTLGPTYQVSGTSGFTIGSYPVSHSVNISATTSSVSSYYEYSLPEYKRNPNGTRDPLWGRTFSPVWDDGTTDPAGQMRKASGEDPVDSTALTLTSVGVGPNRSLKYIASSIALGPVMSYYSVALTGTGEFASRQTGSGPGSPTPPYCDKTVQLDLFTLLSTYVRKHEGEVTGATSHFDFFKAQANGSAGQRTAQYLQRSWYRDWSPNPASVVSARLQGEIHKAGLSDHQSLDATLAANKNSIASCTWL